MIHIDNALTKLKEKDSLLEKFTDDLKLHLESYNKVRFSIAGKRKIKDIANGYMYFGFHKTKTGWVFREWLPGADKVWLYGDFNLWNKASHPLKNIGNGVWEIKLKGEDALKHEQCVKLIVEKDGKTFERIPAYIRFASMDNSTHRLCGQVWAPKKAFKWTDAKWIEAKKDFSPVIYEAHIGMAKEEGGIGSYREFADSRLSWIKKLGYNCVQLMAIAEHPYYASFGYQVTNFFAPSHRYGTPDDLKYLINKAHRLGICVLLDVVHSHACANEGEGLNFQDGTDYQYFHSGERGRHSAWQTRCFNYGKSEVIHFLLSNIKYWQEEFHFDGFRFDGVTSMLYENHALETSFTSYEQYYSLNTSIDARVYLMLANELIHEINPQAISIAEDMSGMPGVCLPLYDGGFGFDYRLSMGVPDMWIKLIKEKPIENWDVMYMFNELTGGRPGEKQIAYCESHDQALVGDKTLIFRLADSEMYFGMSKSYHSPSIDTALDMHKLIRFLTASLSDGGYLNFMGNEFGHPEWIDFPREGNNWSYHYARRQWSLVENSDLKYEYLANFDREMLSFIKKYDVMKKPKAKSLWLDGNKNIIIFERGNLVYIFNLHPTWSQEDVFINCHLAGGGKYRLIFSSDDESFGGQGRVSKKYVYTAKSEEYGYGFRLYVPCRTAVVLKNLCSDKTL